MQINKKWLNKKQESDKPNKLRERERESRRNEKVKKEKRMIKCEEPM